MATAEHKILHLVWKKAYAEGEVRITQHTKQEAARLRMMLYSSVQAVKKAPHLDYALADAAAECFITLEDEGRTVLIKTKISTGTMQSMMDVLGITEAEVRAQGKKEKAADRGTEENIMNSLHSGPLAGLITKE